MNVLEYIIRAKDATSSGLKSATNGIKSFASSVGSNLANIKAGFDMVKGAVSSVASFVAPALKEAFKFETDTANFTTLLGSIDNAKTHLADLKQFAASTPLSFSDVADASKQLLSFGINVKDIMPSLQMLGDISMGNSEKFKGLALVFAQVKSAGKLMGQDLLQMINQGFNPLTIISQQTGRSMAELKELMGEGAISFEMVEEAMRVATSAGGLFNGAMAESAKTGEGMISTLKDKWSDGLRVFGNALMDASKGGLQFLTDKITELTSDGTIEVWAQKATDAFQSIMDKAQVCTDGVKGLGVAFNWVYEKLGISDAVHGVNSVIQGVANGIGTAVGGGSFWEGYNDASEDEIMKGYYGRKAAGAGWLGESAKQKYDAQAVNAQEEVKAAKAIKETAIERQRAAREEQEASKAKAQSEQGTSGNKLSEMLAKQEEDAKKSMQDRLNERAKQKDDERLDDFEDGAEEMMDSLERYSGQGGGSGGGGFAPIGGGGGGGGDSGGGTYQEQKSEIEAQIEDLKARQMALYRQKLAEARQNARKMEENRMQGNVDYGGYADLNSYITNYASQAASSQYGTQIADLRKKVNDLEGVYAAGGMSDSHTSASERTAAACEGILRHFESNA